ncbi:hypothetical protein [Arthrobacter rhombi]|uniref:hypothetical protein n=1 Tax=Arthrobacter rhombi TaxID=71253 RepID=UPI003FD0B044
MANAEVLMVDWFNADTELAELNIQSSLAVPEDRPKRFITVERTGGPGEWFRDVPTLAVQVWAPYQYEAGDLAATVAGIARGAVALPNVARCKPTSIHNFPDPYSKHHRYQIVLELVTTDD